MYINRELLSYISLYEKCGWCKKLTETNSLEQFQMLLKAVEKAERHIEAILDGFIIKKPEIRKYMILHSVFPIYCKYHKDWLQQYMITRLMPTESEVIQWTSAPDVPQELMDAIKEFDPEALPDGVGHDPIRIEYKMYGVISKGESSEPIDVIDTDFEKIKTLDIIELIKSAPEIDLSLPVKYADQPSYFDDSDLPF